jgi:hypothetical protein
MEERARKDPRACPNCGSRHIKTVATPENEITVSGNRSCRDCGCRWRPALPKWGGYVALVAGSAFAATIMGAVLLSVCMPFSGYNMVKITALTIIGIPFTVATIRYSWGVVRGTRGELKILQPGAPPQNSRG